VRCETQQEAQLSYRNARRSKSVEILSTAAQLYEKSRFKRLTIDNDLEGHSRSSEMSLVSVATMSLYCTVSEILSLLQCVRLLP